MGSCGVRTIKDDDGGSYEFELRDCGDYYEGVPKRVYVRDKAGDLKSVKAGIFPGMARVDLSTLRFKGPSRFVFVLPKPKPEDPPLTDDEYNKIVCEINSEMLVRLRRGYSLSVNNYIKQKNAEIEEKYFAAIRDCKKKHGLDFEKLNSVSKEESLNYACCFMMPYFNGSSNEAGGKEVGLVRSLADCMARKQKVEESFHAKMMEALSS